MKIIFLDIDGVINISRLHNIFDQNCCLRLKEILDTTGAKIVVSSSWRLYDSSIEEMLIQLKMHGITKNYFLDKTNNLENISDFGQQRLAEIEDYIDSHGITEYIILDDYPLYNIPYPKSANAHFIKTLGDKGITEEIKELAISKLK